MTRALDVLCVGESLVDFLPGESGRWVGDVETWTRCAGGSVANVAVGLARLKARSALLSVVGKDAFGSYLYDAIAAEGVDVSHVRRTQEGKTGLAFVSLDEQGERSFAFYRTRSAELFLGERDVDPAFIHSASVLHWGTNALLFRNAQVAVLRMVQLAAEAGRLVSCDPNLRMEAWPDVRDLREILTRSLPLCSVVKLAEDETEFVTGRTKPEEALTFLAALGVALPVITLGAQGAMFFCKEKFVRVQAPLVKAVDTTGAGDGFMAGLLFGLTRLYPDRLALSVAGVGELRELVAFACRVGSSVVQKQGALPGLPRLDELEAGLPRLLQ